MNILFIHQNFPGQFKHLAPALVQAGHKAVALTLRVKEPTVWNGVRVLPYKIQRKPGQGVHPWLVDFETKMLRAESCFAAACKLRDSGFEPDIIVAHPGWGESMFLRDVWPNARIGLYYELYYRGHAGDIGFDAEFPQKAPALDPLRLRLKNINNMMHLPVGDMGISPTQFQANSFPPEFREKISVIHDGIDTNVVRPDSTATFDVSDELCLGGDDEVITFVNRNLEPYRGYHVFMRALPRILKERPNARVLIVGGDDVSYGAKPPKGQTWKQKYIDEVRDQITNDDWDRVHFLGRIPYAKFLQLLQISSAHVYLTYPFVLSWSLIEAMSASAPIVASATDPVKEVIQHDKNGRLFDFFDQDALVAQVCDVLENADVRARLGANARKTAVTRFDLASVCLPKQLDWIETLYQMPAGRITL